MNLFSNSVLLASGISAVIRMYVKLYRMTSSSCRQKLGFIFTVTLFIAVVVYIREFKYNRHMNEMKLKQRSIQAKPVIVKQSQAEQKFDSIFTNEPKGYSIEQKLDDIKMKLRTFKVSHVPKIKKPSFVFANQGNVMKSKMGENNKEIKEIFKDSDDIKVIEPADINKDKKPKSVKEEVPSWYPCNVSYDPGLNQSFWRTNSPHNYKYIINNENKCSGKNISVMFMIISAPENEKIRQLARDTWISITSYAGLTISHVFLLGNRPDSPNDQIRKENDLYHDIVQEDFIDSYRNLTVKSIMALKWATTYCKNAKLIFKMDDDTLVNTFLLLKLLKEKQFLKSKSILCNSPRYVADDLIPVRDLKKKRNNKWILTRDEYPENCFPTYCAGSGYAMNQQIASKLYQAALNTRMLTIEDVYVTGILPALSGVRYRKLWLADFGFYWDAYRKGEFRVWDFVFVAFTDVKKSDPLKIYMDTWKYMVEKTRDIKLEPTKSSLLMAKPKFVVP